MGKNYGISIEEHYRREFCTECVNGEGCKMPLHTTYDEQTKTTTLKCAEFERKNNDEDLNQLLAGAHN